MRIRSPRVCQWRRDVGPRRMEGPSSGARPPPVRGLCSDLGLLRAACAFAWRWEEGGRSRRREARGGGRKPGARGRGCVCTGAEAPSGVQNVAAELQSFEGQVQLPSPRWSSGPCSLGGAWWGVCLDCVRGAHPGGCAGGRGRCTLSRNSSILHCQNP